MRTSCLAILTLVLLAAPLPAQLAAPHDHPAGLQPVTPDEDVETILHERFSLATSLEFLTRMREALLSFEQLTEEVRARVPAKRLAEIGNTDPEMQTIGFRNLPNAVEGTLLLQAWSIASLKLDLARERKGRGATGEADVVEAEKALAAAETRFREFWKGFGISD